MKWQRWTERWEAALSACERIGGNAGKLVIKPPASTEAVAAVERELGRELPASLREVLTGFAAEVWFRWSLPDDLKLAPPLNEIFGGECRWSLEELVSIEESRKSWVRECFPNPNDPYDRVWHNKLAFAHIKNGDLLVLDISVSPAPVVYLSHDDGEGHGYLLGADFADFIDRWTLLACPGPENWQMMPFLPTPTGYLNPHGAAAQLWRKTFGLRLLE